MAEETITLSKRDAERLRVIYQVMDGMITAEPSLAASDLRERTTHMRPEVFTLPLQP